MISHGNLMHHCTDLQKARGYTSESIATTWVPHFHDYGLVDGLLQPPVLRDFLLHNVSCKILYEIDKKNGSIVPLLQNIIQNP